MSKKISSIIFIVAGLTLLAYPKAAEMHSTYLQKKLVSEWQAALAAVDQGERAADPAPDQDAEESSPAKESPGDLPEEFITPEEKDRQDYIHDTMEGMLKIEKIGLELPILKGVTEANLDLSVAHMENTGNMGEPGNYAIAGHRSHTYGRQFNRLEEVNPGDRLEVTDGKTTYTYTVTQKLYVDPTETYVLNSNKDISEITLITCHPMINPTHRLIIKGVLGG
ncbi:sortase family protein [Desulfitobacterium hafniense DCB-2]|uniref:Sortase family protein n=2 Tax=root TaxID=1 RepID=B8FUN7_DESHD|nr:class D sortase [Desulfitobacterium hafniense]ACL22307.1 sortase family protein [Desulfitobacterium hafniense DCB-2]MEA5021411.1 class D sortase [Desulfitobacterium hafniense]